MQLVLTRARDWCHQAIIKAARPLRNIRSSRIPRPPTAVNPVRLVNSWSFRCFEHLTPRTNDTTDCIAITLDFGAFSTVCLTGFLFKFRRQTFTSKIDEKKLSKSEITVILQIFGALKFRYRAITERSVKLKFRYPWTQPRSLRVFFFHLGVFLISVKPLATKITENESKNW